MGRRVSRTVARFLCRRVCPILSLYRCGCGRVVDAGCVRAVLRPTLSVGASDATVSVSRRSALWSYFCLYFLQVRKFTARQSPRTRIAGSTQAVPASFSLLGAEDAVVCLLTWSVVCNIVRFLSLTARNKTDFCVYGAHLEISKVHAPRKHI